MVHIKITSKPSLFPYEIISTLSFLQIHSYSTFKCFFKNSLDSIWFLYELIKMLRQSNSAAVSLRSRKATTHLFQKVCDSSGGRSLG